MVLIQPLSKNLFPNLIALNKTDWSRLKTIRNFSTYRITFLNNQDEFNNSKQIELAEIDLLGVPGTDTWLSTAPILHIGDRQTPVFCLPAQQKLEV